MVVTLLINLQLHHTHIIYIQMEHRYVTSSRSQLSHVMYLTRFAPATASSSDVPSFEQYFCSLLENAPNKTLSLRSLREKLVSVAKPLTVYLFFNTSICVLLLLLCSQDLSLFLLLSLPPPFLSLSIPSPPSTLPLSLSSSPPPLLSSPLPLSPLLPLSLPSPLLSPCPPLSSSPLLSPSPCLLPSLPHLLSSPPVPLFSLTSSPLPLPPPSLTSSPSVVPLFNCDINTI